MTSSLTIGSLRRVMSVPYLRLSPHHKRSSTSRRPAQREPESLHEEGLVLIIDKNVAVIVKGVRNVLCDHEGQTLHLEPVILSIWLIQSQTHGGSASADTPYHHSYPAFLFSFDLFLQLVGSLFGDGDH